MELVVPEIVGEVGRELRDVFCGDAGPEIGLGATVDVRGLFYRFCLYLLVLSSVTPVVMGELVLRVRSTLWKFPSR